MDHCNRHADFARFGAGTARGADLTLVVVTATDWHVKGYKARKLSCLGVDVSHHLGARESSPRAVPHSPI